MRLCASAHLNAVMTFELEVARFTQVLETGTVKVAEDRSFFLFLYWVVICNQNIIKPCANVLTLAFLWSVGWTVEEYYSVLRTPHFPPNRCKIANQVSRCYVPSLITIIWAQSHIMQLILGLSRFTRKPFVTLGTDYLGSRYEPVPTGGLTTQSSRSCNKFQV